VTVVPGLTPVAPGAGVRAVMVGAVGATGLLKTTSTH
jgi:hypothetical protein